MTGSFTTFAPFEALLPGDLVDDERAVQSEDGWRSEPDDQVPGVVHEKTEQDRQDDGQHHGTDNTTTCKRLAVGVFPLFFGHIRELGDRRLLDRFWLVSIPGVILRHGDLSSDHVVQVPGGLYPNPLVVAVN